MTKGSRTVGTQRQYTGTADRIENAQVAVYLTYAGQAGHAMIDRELYLPRCWANDSDRRAAAGVPEQIELATKPALACTMIDRALAACVPAGAWARLSAGRGAKGHRYHDWAWVALTGEPGHHWLLVRRHPRHGELAFYRCYSPTPVRLGEPVWIAGRRWSIEECFQAGKGLAGLDEHQVRRWLAWRRWTLLAMLAHALLAVIAAVEPADHPPPDGLIILTCNEIRHLLTNPHAWSHWRRRHQHHARACRYRRQQAQLT